MITVWIHGQQFHLQLRYFLCLEEAISGLPFLLPKPSVSTFHCFSIDPIRLLGVLITVQLVFIVTHWEKYNTGILFLSWGYDASQYVSKFSDGSFQKPCYFLGFIAVLPFYFLCHPKFLPFPYFWKLNICTCFGSWILW